MRILLVEDEFVIATMLQDMLLSLLPCEILWASRVARAMQLVHENEFDGAILDVNVAGEKIYDVAELLRSKQVPMVFSTGYSSDPIAVAMSKHAILKKPYARDALSAAVAFLKANAPSRPKGTKLQQDEDQAS